MRDLSHERNYLLCRDQIEVLERKRMVHFHEVVARDNLYCKVMALFDFIGLLLTNRDMRRRKMVCLACDETFLLKLGSNLYHYQQEIVSRDVAAAQYGETYDLAGRRLDHRAPLEAK